MGRCIVKLADDKYIEWSSGVDAPISAVMSRNAMKKFGVTEDRLTRADTYGTSLLDYDGNAIDYVSGNRAGEHETELTLEEIIEKYT